MAKELFEDRRLEKAAILENETTPSGDRKVTFEAVVSEADYINANGRMYPMNVLWPAFQQVNEDIAAYPGAVDHPEYRASFRDNGIAWESFWLEGNYVKGRGSIIWTASGQDLAANLVSGVKVGFSTRTYANYEEVEIDGRTVRKVTAMEPPFVDAVVTPSVKHARVLSVTKEEQEMNEELKLALEDAGAAKAKLAETTTALETAQAKSAELEGQLAERDTKVTALESRVAELETQIEDSARRLGEDALTNRLMGLTSEHRFGAAIRAQALKVPGLSLENAEAIVGMLTPLIEAAGAAANEDEGTPRGDLSTTEDEDRGDGLTDEQRADLVAAGLMR